MQKIIKKHFENFVAAFECVEIFKFLYGKTWVVCKKYFGQLIAIDYIDDIFDFEDVCRNDSTCSLAFIYFSLRNIKLYKIN